MILSFGIQNAKNIQTKKSYKERNVHYHVDPESIKQRHP